MATVSFLASRLVPSGSFWFALTGGATLARDAERRGARSGYASALAAMLQTMALLGPLRFSAPLTQALSAPLLGAMHRRGRGRAALFAVCLVIRLVQYAAFTAFTIWILLGPKAFAGSYNATIGSIGVLPRGLAGALLITAVTNLAAAIFYSAVQIVVYRQALERWPSAAGKAAADDPGGREAAPERAGVDARAALAAAAIVTSVLLISHAWTVLAAASLWLAAAAVFARHGDREILRVGLLLAGIVAVGTLGGSLIGGLGATDAGSRAVRAALLVAVATWLRLAATSSGLREAFRRGLLRFRRLRVAHEAAELLGQLESDRLLAASAHALRDRLRNVRLRPAPVADAVLDWAAREAASVRAGDFSLGGSMLRLRARDAVLALSALAPSCVLAAVLGG